MEGLVVHLPFLINADGIPDLVVGEPYAGAETLTYNGGVQVFYGSFVNDHYSLDEGFSIKCMESPCGLGTTMTLSQSSNIFGEDSGLEVWIGAQSAGIEGRQRGAIISVKQDINWESGREYTVPGDIEWVITGQQDFEQLGTIIAGPGYRAVASPTFRLAAMEDGSYSEDDVQATGHVNIIMESGTVEIVGSTEFGALGSSLAVVNMTVAGELRTLLAVGESSADSEPGGYLQTGRVHLYQVNNMEGEVEKVGTFSGSSEVGRFGMKVLGGWDGGMLVGAPYTGLGLHNYGKVYFFPGDQDIPADDVTSHCVSSPSPCTGEWATLEITQHEQESLFGSNIRWEEVGEEVVGKEMVEKEVMLVVAAERSSLGARIGGTLYVYRYKTT